MKIINIDINDNIEFKSIKDSKTGIINFINSVLSLPANNYNNILLNFNFISPDAIEDGLRLFAIFSTNHINKPIMVEITDIEVDGEYYKTACLIPVETLQEKGNVILGIYGYILNDDGSLNKRISLTPTVYTVNTGSYKEDAVEGITPTPTVFEEYFAKIDDMAKVYVKQTQANQVIKSLQTNLDSEAATRESADYSLQSQINSLASGSPLVATSIQEMTDTTRVYVNTTDGHWYFHNGAEWVDGGVYQAVEIADESVNVEKTNFAKRINCFNHLTAKSGRIQKYVGNSYDNISTTSANYRYSDLYDIKEGDIVRVKYPDCANYPVGIVWCDENKIIIQVDSFPNYSKTSEFIAPEGSKYFEFDINITNQVSDWTQETMCTINEEMPTGFIVYEAFTMKDFIDPNINEIKDKISQINLEIADESLNIEKTNFAKRINHFNYLTAKSGRIQKYVDNYYDNVESESSTYYKYSDLYSVKEGDIVRVKYPNTATYTLGIVWCDDTKKIIKVDLFANWSESAEFTAPADAKYFEFDINITNQVSDWTQETMCTINEEMPTGFIAYEAFTMKDFIDPNINEIKDKISQINLEITELKPNSIKNVVYNPSNAVYIFRSYIGKRKIPFKNLLIGYNVSNYRLKSRVSGYEKYGYCGDYIIFSDDSSNFTKPFSLIKRDNKDNTELSYKNICIYNIDPSTKSNPTSIKNVLMIGDSFTQGGYLPWYVQDFIKNHCGFSNFNFIGHKTFTNENVEVRHSGCGGFTVKDFIKTDNTEGRGTTYRNPFLSDGTVSISNAIAEIPDICVIELGVNDLLDNHTTTQLTSDLTELITIIKNVNSNCDIYLVGYIYMSENNNYMDEVVHNLKIQEFNKSLEEFANNNSYTFVDVSTMFNFDIGYKYENKETYPGSGEYVKMQTDYLHPGEIGYKMEAENIAATIIKDL